jgi:hypothetical protein
MSTKIRALIADDEPLARKGVQAMLKGEADVAIIGESADGLQTVAAIQEKSPDLIFLDVQMPGWDGFGVIEQVGIWKEERGLSCPPCTCGLESPHSLPSAKGDHHVQTLPSNCGQKFSQAQKLFFYQRRRTGDWAGVLFCYRALRPARAEL